MKMTAKSQKQVSSFVSVWLRLRSFFDFAYQLVLMHSTGRLSDSPVYHSLSLSPSLSLSLSLSLSQSCLKTGDCCTWNLKTEALTFDLELTWNSTAAADNNIDSVNHIFLFQFLSLCSSCLSHIHVHGAFMLGKPLVVPWTKEQTTDTQTCPSVLVCLLYLQFFYKVSCHTVCIESL